jgi:aldose sugar dehydrogenase
MKKLLLSAVVLTLSIGSAVLAQQAPPPAGAPAAAPAPAAGPAAGRGGRGPNPQALMFTARCASCHGTDLAGARAASLFNHEMLSRRTDEQLRQVILNGNAAVDMPAFRGQISEEEVDQLIVYLRLQGGQLRTLPTYVPDPNNQVLRTQKQTVRIEVLATGLDTPWGAAFLPDGRLLVTERAGRIRILDKDGKLQPEAVKGTPAPWVRQDGGYFDIAVHPDYARNGWVYLSYSEIVPGYSGPMPAPGVAGPPGGAPPLPPSNTRIVRGRINANNEWVDQQDIVKIPNALYTPSIIHYGQRFLFDGKGHLFWTLGDRGDITNGQDLSNPMGKVHRINDDGSIPKDNPFVTLGGAWPSIWSYGNRNAEGLAFDPRSGLLWESEHGPTGGDEINVIEKGKDYGWGVVSMGTQAGITRQHAPLMIDPIAYYTPTIGPSGISFYTGNRYPGWKNSLFVAALTGQKLLRLEVNGRRILSQETIFEQFGRTRQVITGPDGLLYILLQNPTGRGTNIPVFGAAPGMVIRLQPVN